MNDLSQAFASALFYRLLLPGLIVAIGVHPLLSGLPNASSWIARVYPGGATALFLAEVVSFGLVAYAAATPVYHCAQGLILPWLTWPARVINGWRFDRKYEQFVRAYGDKSYDEVDGKTAEKLQQLFIYLSDYPIEQDEDGIPRFTIRHATRVGNITATYERYPDTRYGINAEAYWDHFLFLLPAEVRKELDSVQATAAGTLLSAAAGWLVFGVTCIAAAATAIGTRWPDTVILPRVASDAALMGLAAYGAAAAVGFNYLTRVAHREYGRLFRACFDVHVGRLTGWLASHTVTLSPEELSRAEALRRYTSALVKPES